MVVLTQKPKKAATEPLLAKQFNPDETKFDINAEKHHLYFNTEDPTEFLPVPSVSVFKGLLWPFDLKEYVMQIAKDENVSYDEAVKIKNRRLAMAALKGVHVHYRAEMYIKTGKDVGCPDGCHVKSHDIQAKNWIKLFRENIEVHNIMSKYAEMTYINTVRNATGQQDYVIQYKDGTINEGDNKTTYEIHKIEEVFQILWYRWLRLGTLKLDFDKTVVSVINTNPGEMVEKTGYNHTTHKKYHYWTPVNQERKNGIYYEFTKDQIKNGQSNVVKSIRIWNALSLHDKIEKIRGKDTDWNWTEQQIQDSMPEYIEKYNSLIVPEPEDADSYLIEGSEIDPEGKDLTAKQRAKANKKLDEERAEEDAIEAKSETPEALNFDDNSDVDNMSKNELEDLFKI